MCLSKRDARHLWPKAHIYWYGPNHCWSNRRGGPPRGIKVDPVKNDTAIAAKKILAEEPPRQKLASPVVKIVRADELNELDVAADAPVYFHPEPFQLYRSLSLKRLDPYKFSREWGNRISGQWEPPLPEIAREALTPDK